MDFANLLIQYYTSKKTGAIKLNEGKKQWVFYFKEGGLSYTRSNIKSESSSSLNALYPDASRDELIHKQALMRLQKGFGPLIKIEELEKSSEKILPYSTLDLYLEMIKALGEEKLTELCSEFSDEKFILSETPELSNENSLNYLSSLDGSRPSSIQMRIVGIDISLGFSSLWLAHSLGCLKLPETGEIDALFDFDLEELIQKAFPEDDNTNQPSFSTPPAEPEKTSPLETTSPSKEEYEEEDSEDSYTFSDEDDKSEPIAQELEQPTATDTQLEQLNVLQSKIEMAENHFDILGFAWDSEADVFERAYRDLTTQLHPDRFNNYDDETRELATVLFDKVREAWEILGDPDKRKAYTDKEIHGIKTEDELAMEELQAMLAADAAFSRGKGLFNQGRLQPAHEQFKIAVESAPDQPEFKGYYGYTTFATLRSSKPEEADIGIDLIKEAIEINQGQEKKLDTLWVLLGRAYREKGEVELAKKVLMRALKMNAANPDAKRELSRVMGKDSKSQKKPEKKSGFFSGLFGGKK
ncbi:MAG: hypothetical protein CMK59_01350 [Proteobacteria bacterium]|nr:hypothetical protein [Pseudomonadota bacterium]